MLRILKWDELNFDAWHRTWWLWNRLYRYGYRYGIKMVHEAPDVIFTGNMHPPREFGEIPAIVENNEDAASIVDHQRTVLELPNVKAMFRNVVFRWPEYYNRQYHDGDYYGHLWKTKYEQRTCYKPLQPAISTESLAKVRHALPMCEPPTEDAWKFTSNYSRLVDRPVDLYFSGRIRYGYVHNPAFPEIHRRQFKHYFEQIDRTKIWHEAKGRERKFPYFTYIGHMLDAKICISPWGWGAWNIRDQEALLCGCILVKPACSGMVTVPDIYDPAQGLAVFCSPDFKDLPDVVEKIMLNLSEYQEMVDRARKVLWEHLNMEQVMHRWCTHLKAVL